MPRVRDELSTAIAEQQMLLWYHPLVDVPSGTICGMEALFFLALWRIIVS